MSCVPAAECVSAADAVRCPPSETAALVREFVLSVRRDFPDQYSALVPTLATELQQKLASIS